MIDNCRKEVLELHTFFEDWFNARLPDTDEAFSRLESVLDPDFLMITPGAKKIPYTTLLHNLRTMTRYYTPAEKPSSIWIRNIEAEKISESLCLVLYEEWQGNREKTDGKGRVSTAIFKKSRHSPNNVSWLHLHETWI